MKSSDEAEERERERERERNKQSGLTFLVVGHDDSCTAE